MQLTIPIGVWSCHFIGNARCYDADSEDTQFQVSLSTSSNSETDDDFTVYGRVYRANTTSLISKEWHKSKFLNISAKTTYYCIIRTLKAGVNDIAFNDDGYGNTIIRAVCSYL